MAKFEEQFPIALDILVRGLRAGHPVTSALELLVSEVPDPIGSEFGIVVAEMNYGYDLRGALTNLAARVRTQDIQMFVVSVVDPGRNRRQPRRHPRRPVARHPRAGAAWR